ncbi:UNVERIFIED_CONTAM: Transcription repressor OFP5 [Sesamum radiatum]|uniref:Transcription repressor n=1 Tax=Sesamum radiatum TaxID=300843 RepID=A0AAW2KHD9_SESRA
MDDDDDDAYWRLSFHGEGIESRRNAGVVISWYDSDDEFQIPVFSCKSLGFREVEVQRRQEHRSFKDLDLKRMREMNTKGNILREHGVLRRRNQMEKHYSEFQEKNIKEFQDSVVSSSRNQRYISFPNLGLSSLEEDYAFAALTGEGSSANSERASISEWQNSEDKKCKEMKLKTETQRKSAYVRREFHSRKIKHTTGKACLPKIEGRIRVLEDLKRARIKVQRKTAKVQVAEGATIFDSFAVVKSSFNPQQDFRDSMVEMIRAKRIRQPEELQELLACYLTLNHDGHHELIIKVFQEYVQGLWILSYRGITKTRRRLHLRSRSSNWFTIHVDPRSLAPTSRGAGFGSEFMSTPEVLLPTSIFSWAQDILGLGAQLVDSTSSKDE